MRNAVNIIFLYVGINVLCHNVGEAKAQKAAFTQGCIRKIHPERDSKKIQKENAIRFEEGMSTDEQDGLPEPDGYNEADGGKG